MYVVFLKITAFLWRISIFYHGYISFFIKIRELRPRKTNTLLNIFFSKKGINVQKGEGAIFFLKEIFIIILQAVNTKDDCLISWIIHK